MLDVKDFGAKGDGLVDDTNAIQTAINSGNEIFIPFGTYLITSSLTLKSDLIITGYGTIKVNTDGPSGNGLKAFTSGTIGIQNIQIIGITIDGGGQVGGVITAGKKGAMGVYLTNATNIIIDKVHIKNCGIMNTSNPFSDAGFSGMGILAECRYGQIKNIKITNCTIENIAGGGIAAGDGISIAGYSSTGIRSEDILISNCTINIVGRNAISIAGATTESLGKNVRVINNYLSNTQLAGVDVEDGTDIILAENNFSKCGNILFYYPYGSTYPATYRLRSAIATGSDSNDVTIANTIIEDSNYGITFGAKLNKITNVFINNSNTSDITQGLASGGSLIITDSQFTTTGKECFKYESTIANEVKITNCSISGVFKIITLHGGTFTNCTFKAGVVFPNPNSEKITWDSCDFSGSGTGIGIDISGGPNFAIKNCLVTNCRFNNLATGILASYNNIIDWVITGCTFTAITTYGIRHDNSGGFMSFKSISDNQFINTSSATSVGISIVQANPRINISQNYFELIATCISITNITSGVDLLDATVSQNLAINCTNGIVIALSTGTWNRCIVIYNNIFGCSTTKISLPASGNAAGFVSNNIV